MEEARIWTEPEIVAFTGHPSDDVRAWAWQQLVMHYPDEAGRRAAHGLSDRSRSVVGRALDAFAKRPTPEARKALEALGKRRDLPGGMRDRMSRLLRGAPERETIDDPHDLEIDRLAASPEELRERAPALLASASGDDRSVALFALSRQPYRWAATIVLERLVALVATESYRLAWEILYDLGDPRALQALIAEWRPGDRMLAMLIARIRRLAGEPDALPPELVRDAEAQAKTVAELEEQLCRSVALSRLPPRPLRLDLRCTRCSRVHEYDVEKAMIHPRPDHCVREGWDGVTLGRIIVCKRCGAEDAYELTTLAKATLYSLAEEARGGSVEERMASRVVVAEARLWDGTICRRPSEALRHLRALAARRPKHGEGWRRLGNLCEMYDRTEEAVAAWMRAALDKDEMEACYSLAKHHHERGDLQKAFELAREVIARLRSVKDASSTAARGAAVERALDIVRAALPLMREPIALMAVWACELRGSKELVMHMSSVDLRTVRRWDRLADLLMSDAFVSARLTPEMPQERFTQLSLLLESDARIGGVIEAAPAAVPSRPTVSRKGPCTCGSGKKYKRCCGQ